MTAPALSEAAQRVQDAIVARGLSNVVLELEEPVKTAQAAADAVGCTAAQIVKSLVFKRAGDADPPQVVLVVASGANRVDTRKLAALLGGEVTMADPKLVRRVTGFAIGGIPPLGHATVLNVIVDRELFAFESLWAAAGHPNSLFPLTPAELVTLTNGQIADIAEAR